MSKNIQIKDDDSSVKAQVECESIECEKINCDSSGFSERFAKNLQELMDTKFLINIAVTISVTVLFFAFDKGMDAMPNLEQGKIFSRTIVFAIFVAFSAISCFSLFFFLAAYRKACKAKYSVKSIIAYRAIALAITWICVIIIYYQKENIVNCVDKMLKLGGSQ